MDPPTPYSRRMAIRTGHTPGAQCRRRRANELTTTENADPKGKTKEKPKTEQRLTAPAEIKCTDETYFTNDTYARKNHIWGLDGRKTCVRE